MEGRRLNSMENAVKATKQARPKVHMSEDHKLRVRQAAVATGQTISNFMLSELLRRADEIIDKEDKRPERERSVFSALLDAGHASAKERE